MYRSGGTLVNRVEWTGTTATFGSDWNGLMWASYSELYRKQLWVSVVVNKRAGMIARLPLKVYQRTADNGRVEARDHPYTRLLHHPNDRHDRVMFWTWTMSTRDIFGEAFWGKIRDAGGRPVQLIPLHPTAMKREKDGTWTFNNGAVKITGIPQEDIVHLTTYNPDSLDRGMSALEPLRATLENEDAARRATSSFWRRGARPGYALSHPSTLSDGAQVRLKAQWDQIASGADKTGVTVVLEEGMKPEKLDLTAEEAQYIETRKLNREEVVAAFDMPPPAVHILDHATFSNITEQFRSLYRDTAAPPLAYFEAALEMQLRGSVRAGHVDPDFGEDVYAEFLLDEVLRGDFESRQAALGAADYLTIAEKRAIENKPFIPGTDRIVVNAANVPLDAVAFNAVGALVRSGFDPEDSLAALGLPPIKHTGHLPITVQADEVKAETLGKVMGRLSWQQSLDQVDPEALTAGLNGEASLVLAALAAARAAGEDVPALRRRLRGMGDHT